MRPEDDFRKSVVLANELDVAGEHIYAAIEKLNRIDIFYYSADSFFFLYNLAVGIERVQKILLVLTNDMDKKNSRIILGK